MTTARNPAIGWWAAITILVSAFLLFQVQPIISKTILPWFGGSPAVWTTCVLFFQLVLLAGYGVISAFSYGWLMDFSFWPFALSGDTQLSFDPTIGALANLHRFVLFNLATSMGWNAGRALTNAVVILVLGTPLLRLFRRTARRAVFSPAESSLDGILPATPRLG